MSQTAAAAEQTHRPAEEENTNAVKRIVLVTHSERANPGKVREALHARGCTTEVRYTAAAGQRSRP